MLDLRLCLRLANRLEYGRGPPLTEALKADLESWYDQLLVAAQRFADIRSYISTPRKQGQSLFEVIHSVFTGRPWMPGSEPMAE